MILLPNDTWEIKETGKRGRGIFAKKDIAPGTVIGDYLGRVIKTAEEDIYEKDDQLYLMYYHDKASIYPTDRQKPGIHLINHSCAPNCWMHTYRGHAIYFAIRRIFKGEELTIAYLLDPLDSLCDPCTHACHCGVKFCSGTMHLPPEYYEKWKVFDDEVAKKTKRERVRYGKELPQLSSYPKEIEDNPIYNLFGSQTHPSKILPNKKLPPTSKLRALIQKTGRTLAFPALHIRILGIYDGNIVSEALIKEEEM